jgi:hypothetical protein
MEEGGNRWKNMDVSSPGFDVSCQPAKKPLYGKRPQKTSFEILARLLS